MKSNQAYKIIELCVCDDCLEAGAPCAMDCDAGEECSGCLEARNYADDMRFAIGCAQGRF